MTLLFPEICDLFVENALTQMDVANSPNEGHEKSTSITKFKGLFTLFVSYVGSELMPNQNAYLDT